MPASLLAARGHLNRRSSSSPGEVSARSKAVTFDRSADFATEGICACEKEKDSTLSKLEHASFTTGLDEAFTALGKSRQFPIQAFCNARLLFNAVYPWAGRSPRDCSDARRPQDPIIFANPSEIRTAVEFALSKGGKNYVRAIWRDHGVTLPSAHPFLDATGARS